MRTFTKTRSRQRAFILCAAILNMGVRAALDALNLLEHAGGLTRENFGRYVATAIYQSDLQPGTPEYEAFDRTVTSVASDAQSWRPRNEVTAETAQAVREVLQGVVEGRKPYPAAFEMIDETDSAARREAYELLGPEARDYLGIEDEDMVPGKLLNVRVNETMHDPFAMQTLRERYWREQGYTPVPWEVDDGEPTRTHGAERRVGRYAWPGDMEPPEPDVRDIRRMLDRRKGENIPMEVLEAFAEAIGPDDLLVQDILVYAERHPATRIRAYGELYEMLPADQRPESPDPFEY